MPLTILPEILCTEMDRILITFRTSLSVIIKSGLGSHGKKNVFARCDLIC